MLLWVEDYPRLTHLCISNTMAPADIDKPDFHEQSILDASAAR